MANDVYLRQKIYDYGRTPEGVFYYAMESPLGVDARSDIYAVGAVGYFLLTGETVFSASSLVELFQKHANEAPIPPSKRSGTAVSTEVENALLASLDKSRAHRPQTARDLEELLRKSPECDQWTIEDGDAWWGRHERGNEKPMTTPSSSQAVSLDLVMTSEVAEKELQLQPDPDADE
jgi:serine/threonine protein kinase